MKLYELKIEDENIDECFALSLVENPAIEADWVYFSEQKKEIKFATVDGDKHLIVAPVLIPDKKIYRIDEKTGEEYYVFFTKETIQRLAQNYLKNGYQNKATMEHQKNIDGEVTVVESWVSDSATRDKSAMYFNRSFPAGTWFVTFKVNDDKLWNDYIKTGVVKAVSIEGIFSHSLVKASRVEDIFQKNVEDLNEEEATILLAKIKATIKSDKRFKGKERIDMESYSDYPDGVKSNAKKALDWAEKNGWGTCGTPVGKQRANQLANGEPISIDTIKRMYSYLSRHEVDLETSTSYNEGCGKLMYDAWGGKAALGWSHNKLKSLGLLEEGSENPTNPSFPEGSSYAGGPAIERKKKKSAEKYIHPALINTKK